MTGDFVSEVEDALTTVLDPSSLEIVASTESNSFGNTAVTFRSPSLLIRIVRERGRIHAEFASKDDPSSWFDAVIVAELFDESSSTSFLGREGGILLKRFARFLQTHLPELEQLFSSEAYQETRARLTELQRESAQRRFGV